MGKLIFLVARHSQVLKKVESDFPILIFMLTIPVPVLFADRVFCLKCNVILR